MGQGGGGRDENREREKTKDEKREWEKVVREGENGLRSIRKGMGIGEGSDEWQRRGVRQKDKDNS